ARRAHRRRPAGRARAHPLALARDDRQRAGRDRSHSLKRERARSRRNAPSLLELIEARSVLVELADEGEREARAHVLEVRADLQAAAVPARLALDLFDRDL